MSKPRSYRKPFGTLNLDSIELSNDSVLSKERKIQKNIKQRETKKTNEDKEAEEEMREGKTKL